MENRNPPEILMHEYRSGAVWGFVWAYELNRDEYRYRTTVRRKTQNANDETEYLQSFRPCDLNDLEIIVRCLNEWFIHSNFFKHFGNQE